MEKKSMQKSIKNLMHLGIDFWKDLGRFWEPKWSHVGTQINQKSMTLAKNEFLKNHCFASGKNTILKVRGVQVGSKNRLKIDQKRNSTWEGILASIFDGFWWISGVKLGSKINQKTIKNGKNDANKKGSKVAKKTV